jgi:hypothetical protein
MAAFLDPGAWGREFTSALDMLREHGGHVDRRRGHAAGDQPASPSTPRTSRTSSACRCRTCTSTTTPTTSRCATTPTSGQAIYDAVGATRTFPTPPYPSTHNLGTNRMSENPRDGVVNKWGQTHDIPTSSSRTAAVHHRRCREPHADHRRAGDPPGRPHRRRDEPRQHLTAGHETGGGFVAPAFD